MPEERETKREISINQGRNEEIIENVRRKIQQERGMKGKYMK
jgi:hypothetical protein